MQMIPFAVMTVATMAKAKAATAAANAEAAQLNYRATQEEAAAQREAAQRRENAERMVSRGLAVGAASGAGLEGIESLLANITERGERDAQGVLYAGEEAAKGLRYQGAVRRKQAKGEALATILSAFGSMAAAGGMGGADKALPGAGTSAGVSGQAPMWGSGDSYLKWNK